MAAEPKKKISKVKGRTRRAHNRAEFTDLVQSKKFPGLSLPHRFRKYFDSLSATDKDLVRATGVDRKSLVSQTTKPKPAPKKADKKTETRAKKTTTKPKSTAKKADKTEKKTDSDK
ncbi:MAG: 50S ribosomal protein L32 [Patescibacteria group bacterium]